MPISCSRARPPAFGGQIRQSSMSRICWLASAVLNRSIWEGNKELTSTPCLESIISVVSWSVCGGSEAGLDG